MKYYIGIDLGGTNIKAGVVNENNEIVGECSVKTNSDRGAEAVVEDMAKAAKSAVEKANISLDEVSWVGVGVPGIANKSTGIVELAVNLSWKDVPLVEMLKNRLGKEVYIENDANAAAYGEYVAGSAKDADTSIMITLGTGVGGGIVINNKIYSGFNYAGAEMGHIVIQYNGRECACGRKGCWERYASATGLIISTKESMEANKDSVMWELVDGDISKVNGRTAFDGMRKGDKAAKAVVDTYINYLACGLVDIINIFQPDIVSIGGGISREGDTLLVPLNEVAFKEIFSRNCKHNTKIVAASLGNDAGIIGAALLGLAQ